MEEKGCSMYELNLSKKEREMTGNTAGNFVLFPWISSDSFECREILMKTVKCSAAHWWLTNVIPHFEECGPFLNELSTTLLFRFLLYFVKKQFIAWRKSHVSLVECLYLTSRYMKGYWHVHISPTWTLCKDRILWRTHHDNCLYLTETSYSHRQGQALKDLIHFGEEGGSIFHWISTFVSDKRSEYLA